VATNVNIKIKHFVKNTSQENLLSFPPFVSLGLLQHSAWSGNQLNDAKSLH